MKMFAFQLQNSLWHKPQSLINQRIATEMIFQPNAGLLGANSDGAQQLLQQGQYPDGQGPNANGAGQPSAHNDVSRYRPLGFEELESDNEEDEDDDDDDDEDDSDDGSREEEDQQAMDSLGDDEEADDLDGQQML